METTVTRLIDLARADWGPTCERAARALAVAIVATYAAGYAAGRILHRLNDRLAGMASGRPMVPAVRPVRPAPIGTQATAAFVADVVRQPLAAATVARPAAVASPPIDTLTVAQLRIVARQRLGPAARVGGRRIAQARRAELLTALA